MSNNMTTMPNTSETFCDVTQQTTVDFEMINQLDQKFKMHEAESVVSELPPSEEINLAQTLAKQIAELQTLVSSLIAKRSDEVATQPATHKPPVQGKQPKNKQGSEPGPSMYVRLGDLAQWGRVPKQQKALADILTEKMEVGKTYTEREVFDFLLEAWPTDKVLSESTQHILYIFKYYRGLGNDGKYAGFVAREFLRVI